MSRRESSDDGRPVLIIDDDQDVRDTLAMLLEQRGYVVLTAVDGADGLRVLRSAAVRPAVILLDLTMPVLDGYDFLTQQRADPRVADVPVALITAGQGLDMARLGRGLPVIRKPFNVAHLVTTVERLRESRPS